MMFSFAVVTVSDEKTIFVTNNISLIKSSTRLPLKDALNLHALHVVADKVLVSFNL